MARISGVNIPVNKRLDISLTYVYGIGRTSASKICEKAKVDPSIRVKDLTEDDLSKVRNIIDSDFTVEGDLKRTVYMNVKRLMDLGCYRGLRHRRGLPSRGQRTHSNAKTRRGGSKSSGVGKK